MPYTRPLMPTLLPLCILLSALLAAPAAVAETPPAKAALTVTVVRPVSVNWATRLVASGPIKPWQEVSVAAELGGLRIAQLRVDVGDVVQPGQELALLAQDMVQAELAQAQARVAQAEASLEEARTNAARARSMKNTGAMPLQQIDQMLTSAATAEANLAAQQAALRAQQIRMQQTRILAADGGVITARMATLGMVVQTGSELFRLVRQNRLEWQAEMAGRDLALLKVGQTAQLTLPTGTVVSGTVRQLAPSLNPETRTAIAYVALAAGSPAKPGMFAEGEIQIGTAAALAVPQAVVILRDGHHYVFSVDASQRVHQHRVEIGRHQAGQVEILSGVRADLDLVATGGAFLADGDSVQVVQP